MAGHPEIAKRQNLHVIKWIPTSDQSDACFIWCRIDLMKLLKWVRNKIIIEVIVERQPRPRSIGISTSTKMAKTLNHDITA